MNLMSAMTTEEIKYTMTDEEWFDLIVDMYVDEWAEEAHSR